MKSTDVIQPLPMQTAIANSGSRDTIPQNQADAQEPFYCSIENGFPDVTMQALNDGGRPPRGQGANGLFYLSTDQRVFLQNGGIITFNEDVSTAIGGYPQGAVLAYKQNGAIQWLESSIDDNTYNFYQNASYIGTYWTPLLPSTPAAAVETAPDIITIGTPTILNGHVSAFTVSDYMKYPIIFNPQGYDWQILINFTTGADVTTEQNLLDSIYGISLSIVNGKTSLSLSSNGTSWDIASGVIGIQALNTNTTYYLKLIYEAGSDYTTLISTDNNIYSLDNHTPSQAFINPSNLLFSGYNKPFGGSIDLNNCTVTINGEKIWTGMDSIGLATKANIDLSNLSAAGEERFNKIYPIGAPIPELSNTLNADEIWLEGAEVSQSTYYRLFTKYGNTYGQASDPSNFKLPDLRGRVLWGTSSGFGYIAAGLPNITGTIERIDAVSVYTNPNIAVTGAFGTSNITPDNDLTPGAGGNQGHFTMTFDASASNNLYGSANTVQPPAVKVRWKTRYQ